LGIHVAAPEQPSGFYQSGVVDRLHRDAGEGSVANGGGFSREQEGAVPKIEKPLRSGAPLERAIGQSVSLEMVALGLIHGDQEPGSGLPAQPSR
jgi:hypothetical protein